MRIPTPSDRPTFRRSRAVALVVAVLLLPAALGAEASPDTQSPAGAFAYSRDDDVIVEYSQVFPQIAGADRGPRMRIRGNGRVEVHYPVYMKRAGDYQLVLTAQELDALMTSLVGNGLMEFDAKALARARDDDPQSIISTVADAATTIIELRLERYTPANAGAQTTPMARKRIVWQRFGSTAGPDPKGDAVKKVAAAERALRDLMEREDLEPLE